MVDHAHQFRGDTLLGGMVLEKCQQEGCGKMRFVRFQEPRGCRVFADGSCEQVVMCSGTTGGK